MKKRRFSKSDSEPHPDSVTSSLQVKGQRLKDELRASPEQVSLERLLLVKHRKLQAVIAQTIHQVCFEEG